MDGDGSIVCSIGRLQMTRSSILLLSIRPKYAAAIYDGNKIYEFRRVVPRHGIPGPALIYETMPVGMVTGWMNVTKAVPVVPIRAAELNNPRDPFADRYVFYLTGARSPCALALSFASRFSTPITLSDLSSRRLRPPQSFCYLETSWLSGQLLLQFYHSNAIRSAIELGGSSDVL